MSLAGKVLKVLEVFDWVGIALEQRLIIVVLLVALDDVESLQVSKLVVVKHRFACMDDLIDC